MNIRRIPNSAQMVLPLPVGAPKNTLSSLLYTELNTATKTGPVRRQCSLCQKAPQGRHRHHCCTQSCPLQQNRVKRETMLQLPDDATRNTLSSLLYTELNTATEQSKRRDNVATARGHHQEHAVITVVQSSTQHRQKNRESEQTRVTTANRHPK